MAKGRNIEGKANRTHVKDLGPRGAVHVKGGKLGNTIQTLMSNYSEESTTPQASTTTQK